MSKRCAKSSKCLKVLGLMGAVEAEKTLLISIPVNRKNTFDLEYVFYSWVLSARLSTIGEKSLITSSLRQPLVKREYRREDERTCEER